MVFRAQICLSVFSSLTILCSPAQAAPLNHDSVAARFKGYKSVCFVLLDCKKQEVFRYNEEQCGKRFAPMSTFKIFNALAGLDSGVLKDAGHLMKWDGEKRWNDAWNCDQTLSSAMRESCVWYFQKVAAGVGEERMKKYMQAVHYGNEDISGGITRFWLASTLSISADEQADFIEKLYFDELPFSKGAMKTVKKIIELKKTPKGELHGKTGSDRNDGKWTMGWFVGYVVHEGQPYVFATNIQADDGAWGIKAREITEKILQDSGLL